ncbi:MAG TPA: RecQ family ATP-dependent DNA helicase [Pirellulales bacterium]|jgi:ATP-dependent DNA helicase RecQ|nr:RecQ family ATP-dependent DNA helicase [Pirellulales bacterium]
MPQPDTLQLDVDAWLPRFGLSSFRPGQRDVISAVMADEDCLCVMPTGGGKSLCYQLPAIARPGLTLVVSPLIALMKDQVDQLQALGLRATFVNSTLSPAEQQARLHQLSQGAYDLVYVVPERFRSPRFVEAVRAAGLQLLAIDEAHCISEWGHDFRPDYARLGRFRRLLGDPPTIALTATATDAVRQDIIAQLTLREPRIFITGFARHNLHYAIQHHSSARRKDEALIAFLAANRGSGIVYASTRKRCEELAELIRLRTGRTSGAYHAGMTSEERHAAQDAFMQGASEIVVATTAFGMGIDKADVRFVVHYNLPGSLEGYYQEAGRAGRDGQPARCLMLFSAGDWKIQEFFIESAYPSREVVSRVYEFLRAMDADPIELTQQEIKESLSLPIGSDGIGTCEQLLEKAGVLERLEPYQNMAIVRIDSNLPTLVDLLPRQAKVQRRVMQAIERLVGGRRYELVYFNPRELLAETELEATALSRTLRELRQLKSLDYIPPFRGRAVHLLDRTKKFSELDIDFQLLDERKAAEYQKLRQVIDFAQGRQCRQAAILDYFGEAGSQPCGHCDNCTPGKAPAAAAVQAGVPSDGHLLQVARMALAGVARSRGRFGKHLIAQMLCGSTSAKITRCGLQKLSTYGLLKPLKQTEVAELLDCLLAGGWLEQVGLENHRPLMQLSEEGQRLMNHPDGSGRLPSFPPALVGRMRQVKVAGAEPQKQPEPQRPPLADKPPPPATERSAPPTASKPPDEHRQTAEPELPRPAPAVEVPAAPLPVAPSPVAASQPTHYWTWRLLSTGFSVDDCAAARGLEREVVLDHALRAIDSGWRVEARWFLSGEQIAALERVVGPGEPQRLRPLLSQLPHDVRYEELQLYLKCRRAAANLPENLAESKKSPQCGTIPA